MDNLRLIIGAPVARPAPQPVQSQPTAEPPKEPEATAASAAAVAAPIIESAPALASTSTSDSATVTASTLNLSASSSSTVEEEFGQFASVAPMQPAPRRVPVAAGPVKAHVTIGSHGGRIITQKTDQIQARVDAAMERIRDAVITRLIEKGDMSKAEVQQFTMSLNHNHHIVKWKIIGQGDYRTYDPMRDAGLFDEAKRIILQNSREIVNVTHEKTGFHPTQMRTTLSGSLGTKGPLSLGRFFEAKDHRLFSGNFKTYMTKEYLKVAGQPGVREAKEVVKDLTSALVYHDALVKTLNKYLEEKEGQLKNMSGILTKETKLLQEKLKREIAEVKAFKRAFDSMHFHPYFVSKTYAADQLTEMAGYVKKHYETIGEKPGTFYGKTEFQPPVHFKELVFKIAAKETLKPTQSEEYIDLCELNRHDLTIGPEDYFLDRLLELHKGRDREYMSLPVFAELGAELRVKIDEAMKAAKDNVSDIRDQINIEENKTDAEIIEIANKLLVAL